MLKKKSKNGMERPLNSTVPSRRDYVLVGILGLVLGLMVVATLYVVAPMLAPLAFLSSEFLGTSTFAIVFLLVLGLIALGEFPLMFYTLIRLARQPAPAWLQLTMHGAYTFFPAVYGALGTVLTGESWWLGVMVLLGVVRLFSSAVGINPRLLANLEMKKREKALETQTDTPPAPKPLPTIAPDALAPADYAPFQRPAQPTIRPLNEIKGFVLDMDGVLYHGERVRAGAIAFAEYLNRHHIPYVCLSNNASKTRADFGAKLEHLGIPLAASQVLGVARATAEWLAERAPVGARMLVVGEPGLVEELRREGFTIVEKAPADYVVVGVDFHLTYEKLKEATLAIRQRAVFIGTNPDVTYPSEEGIVPGNGAQLAYLQAATGKTPTLIGKPEAAMMEVALAHLGLPATQVAMVGDRLDTDILGGKNVGMTTILLLGGVTSMNELAASAIKPDYVLDDLAALQDELEK
jgi:4-nitrophenyl phosphatase